MIFTRHRPRRTGWALSLAAGPPLAGWFGHLRGSFAERGYSAAQMASRRRRLHFDSQRDCTVRSCTESLLTNSLITLKLQLGNGNSAQ
eukprot:363317-Hanusia_phi.AAC.1